MQVAFSLRIVHVDESAAWAAGAEQQAAWWATVQQAADPYMFEGVQFECVALEDVFKQEEPDPQLRRQRLKQLLQVCWGADQGSADAGVVGESAQIGRAHV